MRMCFEFFPSSFLMRYKFISLSILFEIEWLHFVSFQRDSSGCVCVSVFHGILSYWNAIRWYLNVPLGFGFLFSKVDRCRLVSDRVRIKLTTDLLFAGSFSSSRLPSSSLEAQTEWPRKIGVSLVFDPIWPLDFFSSPELFNLYKKLLIQPLH